MKTFLLGFAEGYFIVSLIIYIATYLMLKNPVNTLFYPEIYSVLSRNLLCFIWALLSRI